jgi:hypothetical protein
MKEKVLLTYLFELPQMPNKFFEEFGSLSSVFQKEPKPMSILTKITSAVSLFDWSMLLS